MKLTDTKETLDVVYPNKEKSEEAPIFTLKKMSYGEVSQIQDSTSVLNEHNEIVFKAGTTSKLKIKYALVSWKNVFDSEGKNVPCTEANKDKIPIPVVAWLIKEIDKHSGLSDISKEERKNL